MSATTRPSCPERILDVRRRLTPSDFARLSDKAFARTQYVELNGRLSRALSHDDDVAFREWDLGWLASIRIWRDRDVWMVRACAAARRAEAAERRLAAYDGAFRAFSTRVERLSEEVSVYTTVDSELEPFRRHVAQCGDQHASGPPLAAAVEDARASLAELDRHLRALDDLERDRLEEYVRPSASGGAQLTVFLPGKRSSCSS